MLKFNAGKKIKQYPPSMLHELGMSCGTDKAYYHKYTYYYEELFHELQNSNLNLLEIGVHEGSSIRMWRKYFPNANIFCVDKSPLCIDAVSDLDRVYGSVFPAQEEKGWNAFLKEHNYPKFDIVIDDGGHCPDQQWATYNFIKKHLKEKSYYIIEDLQAYWAWKDGRHSLIDNMLNMITVQMQKKESLGEMEVIFRYQMVVVKNNG